MSITEREFIALYVMASTETADELYPQGVSEYRGQYLVAQGVLCARLIETLRQLGVINDAGEPRVTWAERVKAWANAAPAYHDASHNRHGWG